MNSGQATTPTDAARADAMDYSYSSADGHRQSRYALGQPSYALRMQRGDERAFRHGSGSHQIVCSGQGHLRRRHQRLQKNPRRDRVWRFVSAGKSA